jgi:hypothetical protein
VQVLGNRLELVPTKDEDGFGTETDLLSLSLSFRILTISVMNLLVCQIFLVPEIAIEEIYQDFINWDKQDDCWDGSKSLDD